MRLATEYERIHGLGAELAAVSVDGEERQAAMGQRWGLTSTRLVADPGGEEILQPLGLFDPEERGGIALPGVVIVDPSGREAYRFESRDFADRTNDEDLWPALEALDLPPVDPGPWVPDVDVPDALKGYFRPEDFNAYFRGNMFAAVAIERRLGDDRRARGIARQHRQMSKASLDAWQLWRQRSN